MYISRLRFAGCSVVFSAAWLTLRAADSSVDPTFLYRRLDRVAPVASELTTATCRYKPLFGAGDSETAS